MAAFVPRGDRIAVHPYHRETLLNLIDPPVSNLFAGMVGTVLPDRWHASIVFFPGREDPGPGRE
ncbi:MAG TPA: hypothetical protein VIL40_03740 [Thermaerobacter sp.]